MGNILHAVGSNSKEVSERKLSSVVLETVPVL
jgi:hypothetical protein